LNSCLAIAEEIARGRLAAERAKACVINAATETGSSDETVIARIFDWAVLARQNAAAEEASVVQQASQDFEAYVADAVQ